MTQRRRMSRAQVERTPEREVHRGVSASTWWGEVNAALPQSARPALRDVGDAVTVETLDELARLMGETRPPLRNVITAESFVAAMERIPARPTWQSTPDAWARRADVERRAVERTGRILVAWLIGRWRRV